MAAVNVAIARLQRQYRSAAKIGRRLFAPAAGSEQTVVYVAGQQRSGTNMLMNVLDRHWRTDVYHETDARAFECYQMRDIEVIRALVKRSSARLVVFKALCELQRLRDLLDAFPKARALWSGASLQRCQLLDGKAVFQHCRSFEADAHRS